MIFDNQCITHDDSMCHRIDNNEQILIKCTTHASLLNYLQ